MCGEIDARTAASEPDSGRRPQYVPVDGDLYDEHLFVKPRLSCDNVVNNYGKQSLASCRAMTIHIVHDCTNGDTQSNLTFVPNIGTSVADYFIISTALFTNRHHMTV